MVQDRRDDRLWNNNAAPVASLFQNKVTFLLQKVKIMLIYSLCVAAPSPRQRKNRGKNSLGFSFAGEGAATCRLANL